MKDGGEVSYRRVFKGRVSPEGLVGYIFCL